MLFHYLTLALFLLQTTLHFSSTHADIFRRLSCDCMNNTLQGYDIHYHSNRLQTSYNFRSLENDWDKHKYDEICWKPPGHEFCYNRNFWGKDQVRLDSKEKRTLPKKGRKEFPVPDCTDQCRRWFGQESSCNKTSGYHRLEPNGTEVWKPTFTVTCSGKSWEFPDL